jgi:FMN-dependent oxidoreductase (nitrilotriacetate monooxygenase family)
MQYDPVVGRARRQAVLNLFASYLHRSGWREPGSPRDLWMDYDLWKTFAQTAERGKFHSVFVADVAGLVYGDVDEDLLSRSAWLLRHEPLTLGAALAAHTERIGIVLTASTTYHQPYFVARAFATLDHLSHGRAGWNVVTSHQASEPPNFGLELPLDHSLRYKRAEEFFDVVTGLWDSWEDDAFALDKASGRYLDPERVHTLDHKGEFFSVAGPLNIARPPQGYPVIAQAGSSEEGRAFASRIAELMYTLQEDLGRAQTFYAEMKAAVEDGGRPAGHLKVLPQLHLVVGRTESEAQEKVEELDDLVDPVVALDQLRQFLDFDLTGYPLDEQLPEIPHVTERARSRQQFVIEMARRKRMTIRELMKWAGRYGAFAGSTETIADRIEEWITSDACDGFNLIFVNPRESLTNFVDLVVPELQRRGLFHLDYTGRTLRENLGLPRPENRYAAARRRNAVAAT